MAGDTAAPVRVMFCIGVMPAFYAAGAEERNAVVRSFVRTRGELLDTENISVRATFDDDQLKDGPARFGQYIVADGPDLQSIVRYTTGLMRAPIEGLDALVWKYFNIETRIGRPLGVSAIEMSGGGTGGQVDGVI